MTLPYASPEQVSRAPLSVATDVYSLGVMLYGLLCGAHPYTPARDTAGGWEDAVLKIDPVPPSEAAADPALKKRLRGDLDTITLKALRKRPAERYDTAAAFADDIERYLGGMPVRARPDSTWYRTQKFIARNSVAVAASAAVLVAIVGGSAVAVWQMIEAATQRDSALQSQQRAEAYSEFMKVLLRDSGAGGRPLTINELLDRGTQILERQHEMSDAVAAYMRYEISRNYLMFNDIERQVTLLQRSADSARRSGDANLLAAAECSIAWALTERDRAQAEARLAEGERALAAAGAIAAYSRADCRMARSRMLQMRGDMAGAIAAIEDGIRGLDSEPVQTWSRRDLLHTQLSSIYRSTERFKEALALSARTLEQVRSSGRGGSAVELTALNNHAGNLIRLGEVVDGAAMQQEALDLAERLNVTNAVGLRTNLGYTVIRLGQPQRALDLALADLPLAEKSGNRSAIAYSQFLASRALLALGRVSESLERLRPAEAVWQADASMYGRQLLEIVQHRADLLLAEQRVAEAGALIERTLADLGYPARTDRPGLDRVLRVAARIALLAGDARAAERFASDTLQLSRTTARDERHSADVGVAAWLRAQARAALARTREAAEDAALAVESMGKGFGADHADTIAAHDLLQRLNGKPPTVPGR
jgi:serine/threonine-protein kinase